MTSSRLFWKVSKVKRPNSSSSSDIATVIWATSAGDRVLSRLITLNSGSFSEKTKVAVSFGEKPCCAREREIPARKSRVGL